MQIIVRGLRGYQNLSVSLTQTASLLKEQIATLMGVPLAHFYILHNQKLVESGLLSDHNINDNHILHMNLRVRGGIDFQHRDGSKIGSGGQLSESQAAVERRERLRKLALETIDITKDPYIMRNHLGTYECKLCLTLHPNEGNYLAHTQGKRHQSNLGRRAAMEAKNAPAKPMIAREAPKRKGIKIGRPGYQVSKSRDLLTRQRSLTFEVDYPESAPGLQPRHRFMSAYEQKVEQPDKNFQYLLFACEPYETVAFKIPNEPVDRKHGRFFTNWDAANHKFILQLFFLDEAPADKFEEE
jgi:splicing factor 3A subunit 2